MKKNPKKEPCFLRREFNKSFKGLHWKDAGPITKDTLVDLWSVKELFTLAASSFVPGGWLGYAVYRVRKYNLKQKPANDDQKDKPPKL